MEVFEVLYYGTPSVARYEQTIEYFLANSGNSFEAAVTIRLL